MKYQTEITIDQPRARVVELFDRVENLYRWHPDLKAHEPLEGEPGQPGAKAKLIYDEGGRDVVVIETVVERDLPETFAVSYEARNLYNLVRNRFVEDGPERTIWRTENEYRFKGLMALLGFLMRRAFPEQTLRQMSCFKEFAESA